MNFELKQHKNTPDDKAGEVILLNTSGRSFSPKPLLSKAIHFFWRKNPAKASEFQREREQLGLLIFSMQHLWPKLTHQLFLFFSHSFLFHSIPFLFLPFFLVLWSAKRGAGFILCAKTLFCFCFFNCKEMKCYDLRDREWPKGFPVPFFSAKQYPVRIMFLSSA